MAGRIENLTPWKPGQSGNPKGRPKRHKAIAEIVSPEKYVEIIDMLASRAAAGQVDAARELLGRIEPAPKIHQLSAENVRGLLEHVLAGLMDLIPTDRHEQALALLDEVSLDGSGPADRSLH